MAITLVDSSSQAINMGLNLPYWRNTTGGSAMFWVRARSSPVGGVYMSVAIGPPPGTTGTSRFSIDADNTGSAPVDLRARRLDGDSSATVFGVGLVPLGAWTHIAVTVDYANGPTGRIYLNGVLDATGSLAATLTTGSTSDTNSKNGAIGSQDDASAGFMSGDFEDARIYDRVLGDAEIATIFACKGTDGIVDKLQARWLMQDRGEGIVVAGATIADLSNNGRAASPAGSPVYVGGIVRGARRTMRT